MDPDKGSLGSLGKEQKFLEEKVFLARDGSANVGLLETCIVEEGQRQLGANLDGQEPESCDIQQDVQEDIAAEGSVTGRGTYARRLEARVFEPANWDRVKQYLITLGLEHLIESIDALGVDDLEDFEFLYREDLMEAGATKEEAEAILNCTGAAKEGRSDPPPMARSGYHRPSRPATQAFQGPAVAARIVHANDRATRVLDAVPGATGSGAVLGATGSGTVPGATGSGAVPGATGSGAVPGATGSSVVPGATGSGAVPGATGSSVVPGATGLGAAPGATGSSVVPGATGLGAAPGATGSRVAPGATGSGAVSGATGSRAVPGAAGSRAVSGATGGSTVPGADPDWQGLHRHLVGARGLREAESGSSGMPAIPENERSTVTDEAGAQGEAHVERVSVDSWGRALPWAETEASSTLGIPLGKGLQDHRNASVNGQEAKGLIGGSGQQEGAGPEGRVLRIFDQEHEGHVSQTPTPEPLGFRPLPGSSPVREPGPLGFRPETNPPSWKAEASIYSLPLAALVCKSIREERVEGQESKVDIVVEDSPLHTGPGRVRKAEEHLDRVLVELRGLCEQQRQLVLDEADQGFDCSLEAQELNRLVELEDELVQELAEARGEASISKGPPSDRISALRLCSVQADVGGGCEAVIEGQKEGDPPLQTRIVSVEEVLKDVETWWNPMLAEYQALVIEKRVVSPVTAQELARREAAGEEFQIIPAKLIFSLKAFTARRKVRCVACGNYLGEGNYTANQLYAGGLDVVSLRVCLVLMVRKQWSAGVVDIKTAFLNAELEGQDLGAKRVVVRTPGLWRRVGICTEMFWDVHRALYGLQISPAAWSRCRDRTLPSLKLHTCSGVVRLRQFQSDGNIWALVPVDAEDPDDASLRLGLLLVYVDDMMILSTPQIIADVIAELGKTWELSPPELLDDGNIHYRGVEICRGEGGVLVHQGSYTHELLARYPDRGGAEVPALKLPDVAPADRQEQSTVRKAQQIAGELLWLSGLTRPELQFAVGMISRTISVNATEACNMGEQVVKYLRRFPARGLWYGSANMSWGEEGDLSRPMGPNSLVGFCDASFAPSSGRSLQSTLAYYSGGLIAWSATRQGMTTLSTAESELVGITSLFTDLRALEPLAREVHGAPITMQMHSDSQAAIAICSTHSNNWRTRHLRIRASYAREALESGLFTLHHVNGTSMKADIGTKPLPGPRFHQLVTALGMAEQPVARVKRLAVSVSDGSLEEKIRILLACLVVASLLEPVEAQGGGSQGLGDRDWQFLVCLAVVTICCWEVFKFLCFKVGQGCCCVISWVRKKPVQEARSQLGEVATALEGPGTPPEDGASIQYVDDVMVMGPPSSLRRRARRAVREAEEHLDGLAQRRRVAGQPRFQFQTSDWADWPPVLTLSLQPVGQDRWEYRPSQRTVLRWHLDSRVRLFTPENTRPPVALSMFTGRRRTWILDDTPAAPFGRHLHMDNWLDEGSSRAYVHFAWIGCTELEVFQ